MISQFLICNKLFHTKQNTFFIMVSFWFATIPFIQFTRDKHEIKRATPVQYQYVTRQEIFFGMSLNLTDGFVYILRTIQNRTNQKSHHKHCMNWFSSVFFSKFELGEIKTLVNFNGPIYFPNEEICSIKAYGSS